MAQKKNTRPQTGGGDHPRGQAGKPANRRCARVRHPPKSRSQPSSATRASPSLDPQLVWTGKDALDEADLEVDAPPIWIQEKIDPRVLIENLRETAQADELEPELTLFETFDGLDDLSLVEFYEHEANWSNRMILGDALEVMASLAEREELRGQGPDDLHRTPPYGIKFGSNWQATTENRDVGDGKLHHTSREVEQIRAFRDTWENGHPLVSLVLARPAYSGPRTAHRLGAVSLCRWETRISTSSRSVLDEVFGRENFVSLITFVTTSGFTQAGALPRNGGLPPVVREIDRRPEIQNPLGARPRSAGLHLAPSS